MTWNDTQEDRTLNLLRELPRFDVSAAQAERLRVRCREGFTIRQPLNQVGRPQESGAGSRAALVVVAAWCLVYLLETIRRAAMVYGL